MSADHGLTVEEIPGHGYIREIVRRQPWPVWNEALGHVLSADEDEQFERHARMYKELCEAWRFKACRALLRVVSMHRPERKQNGLVCCVCYEADGKRVAWPCVTYQAIEGTR